MARSPGRGDTLAPVSLAAGPLPADHPLLGDWPGDALAARLSEAGAVWLAGAAGRGKTVHLRAVWTALEAAAEPWLVVPLDLAEPGDPVNRAAALFAEAAARRTGTPLPLFTSQEWLAWWESGDGARQREAIEAAFRARLAMSVGEARRRLGAGAVADLLADYAEQHGLARPHATPAAEKLAGLFDQVAAPGLRAALLVDNAEAELPPRAADLLSAVAEELPHLWGQPWHLLAAGVGPPPARLRGSIHVVELPSLPRAAVAAELGRADPNELLKSSDWDWLEALLRGHPAPVRLLADALELALVADPPLPLPGAEVLADPRLALWVGAWLPAGVAAVRQAVAERPAEDRAAAMLLLAQAAAGREGLAELPGAVQADGVELRLFRAASAAAERVTAGGVAAARLAALAAAAGELAREVVWENVCYRGEVGFVTDPEAAPAPAAETAFRVVLAGPAGLPAEWEPADPRVVALTLGPMSGEAEGLVALAALRGVAAGHGDPEVRQAAAEALPGRLQRAAELAAGGWLSGAPHAVPPLPRSWQNGLARLPLSAWTAALLRPRLAYAHDRRADWVAPDKLAEPLDEPGLAAAWQARLAGSDAGPVAGLHLSPGQKPPGFTELRQRLAARGGALPVPPLLAELTAPPHGLTPELAKLFLLAFVLAGDPPLTVEVTGLRPEVVRLDPAELRRTAFDALRPGQLRRLVQAGGRSWAELLPFARALLPGLAPGAGMAQLEAALMELGEQAERADRDLRYLAEQLHARLPEGVPRDLERLRRVADSRSAEELGAGLAACFDLDEAAWSSALAAFGRWREVAAQAEPLAEAARWLRAVELPEQHPLTGDVLALQGQLRLDSFLAGPHLVRGWQAQADHFHRQYAAAYRAAHRDHHESLRRLRREQDAVTAKAAALGRLNRLTLLGAPDGAAALAELEDEALRPCDNQPELTALAHCPGCGWRFGEEPPTARLEQLRRAMDAAFDARAGRLRGLLTEELVARSGSDDLAALHQVLALQQAAGLPDVLTAETVDLLARCLDETSPLAEVFARLRARYAEVTRENADAVVVEFAWLLAERLTDGRRMS